jgi:hypothetical protein
MDQKRATKDEVGNSVSGPMGRLIRVTPCSLRVAFGWMFMYNGLPPKSTHEAVSASVPITAMLLVKFSTGGEPRTVAFPVSVLH